MSMNRRIGKLEEQAGADGRYFAVVKTEEGEPIPETVEAYLPGGHDRQEMAADDPRLGHIIIVEYTETPIP